jgi:Ca-activated chloride channel family protein
MNSISILEFLELKNLWILLLLLLLLVLAYIFHKARQKIREKLSFNYFTDLPLLFIVPTSIILLLAIAAIRPSTGRTVYQVPVESPALFILFDVSDSMLAKDLPPNRLVFAKRALLDLITTLRKEQQRVRLSIITFAGRSAVFCPLTADYEVLKLYINSLDPQLISTSGSNLSDALNTAEKTINFGAMMTRGISGTVQGMMVSLKNGQNAFKSFSNNYFKGRYQ